MIGTLEPTAIHLVGGGGHATVVHEAAVLSGTSVRGYFDDYPHSPIQQHLARLGNFAEIASAEGLVILAIGDLNLRRRLLAAYQGPFANVIHPGAILSPRAKLGSGSFVGAGAVVNPYSSLGAHSIVNSRAVVEHHCVLESNCHVAPGAVLGGSVSVGENTLIGIGALVIPGIRIGANCTIGAGAVVTQDVPDGTLVVGVPAKPIPRAANPRDTSSVKQRPVIAPISTGKRPPAVTNSSFV